MATFACSSGKWFEEEVEAFVRERLAAKALADTDRLPNAYRLLVVEDGDRLAAVAGHHLEVIPLVDGNRIATRLHLVALAHEYQGRRLADERRLSDLVMAGLIADAVAVRTTGILTAVAARDNHKSIAMCERNGLINQVRHGLEYVRLSGWFASE